MAEHVDVLFQLITNAMGRGAYPQVRVLEIPPKPNILLLNPPLCGADFFHSNTEVHQEPINTVSRSRGEKLALCYRRSCAHTPLAALPLAAARGLWSRRDNAALCPACSPRRLRLELPALSAPLWFQSSALFDVSRTFLSFTARSAAWFLGSKVGYLGERNTL